MKYRIFISKFNVSRFYNIWDHAIQSTDGHAQLTQQVILSQNISILLGLSRLLVPLTHILKKLLYPFVANEKYLKGIKSLN